MSTLGKSIVGIHYPDSHPPPTPIGEACWWTMHPASKQRSEGEKVRVGDDLILVSVSSERYLVSDPVVSSMAPPPAGVPGMCPISHRWLAQWVSGPQCSVLILYVSWCLALILPIGSQLLVTPLSSTTTPWLPPAPVDGKRGAPG